MKEILPINGKNIVETYTTTIKIGLTRPALACVVVCNLRNWLNTFICCLVRPIFSDVATFSKKQDLSLHM